MEALVPIFVCFFLPVAIVFLVMWTRRNETNKKTEIILKAIEAGQQVNPDLFKDNSKPQTVKQSLFGKLTGACVTSMLGVVLASIGIFMCATESWNISESPAPMLAIAGGVLLAVGIALFISYFVGKKMFAKEIESENLSAATKE